MVCKEVNKLAATRKRIFRKTYENNNKEPSKINLP